MIFGIGTDVVQLSRVEEIYARHGEHFVRRLLMPEEETAFRTYKRPVRFLAMRFAAKEAIVKALGTGFAHGVWIRDVGVQPNAWGRPEVIWSEIGEVISPWSILSLALPFSSRRFGRFFLLGKSFLRGESGEASL